jgi:hypothetical protein
MERNGQGRTIANWITDWLPDEKKAFPPKPITPPAEPIRITREGAEFMAHVVLDHLGLPWPIPVGAP